MEKTPADRKSNALVSLTVLLFSLIADTLPKLIYIIVGIAAVYPQHFLQPQGDKILASREIWLPVRLKCAALPLKGQSMSLHNVGSTSYVSYRYTPTQYARTCVLSCRFPLT